MTGSEQKSLISVIMPAYNCASFVKMAIQSVLLQTYSSWELLIADDGSTDNTRAMIDGLDDDRIRRFHSDTNQGQVVRCNELINQARGEFVIRLDADDWMSQNRLELQLNEFKKNPKLEFVLGGVTRVDNNNELITRKNLEFRAYPLNHQGIVDHIQKKDGIPCDAMAVMMFKLASFKKLGGFREEFSSIGSEDIDLFLRLLLLGEVSAISQILYYYRYNPISSSRSMSLNPLKLNSNKLVFFLYKQRLSNQGLDDLSGLNSGNYDRFKNEILAKYKKDPALIYLHHVKAENLPVEDRLAAVVKSIRLNPFKIKSYRYFVRLLPEFLKKNGKIIFKQFRKWQ